MLPNAVLARCDISDGKLQKTSPNGELIEGDLGNNNAIIEFSVPNDCPARKPQTICLDVWNTTACPPGGVHCESSVRGNIGINIRGEWARSGRMICNPNFGIEHDVGGTLMVTNRILFTVSIPDDSVRSDRQNYLIVVAYDPVRFLGIAIRDDD